VAVLRSVIPPSVLDLSRPLRHGVRRLLFQWRMSLRHLRRAPRTINEKILFRMAFDRRPLWITLSDKVAVREFVAARVGPDVLAEHYAVVERPEELDLDRLPERFVVKPSHGSGAVIIVDDRAPADARLDPPASRSWCTALEHVRKEALRDGSFRAMALNWLAASYSPVSEWAYWAVPPRLVVEELLEDEDGAIPADYKFWCFDGEVAFIQVLLDRLDQPLRSIHLPDWTPIEGDFGVEGPAVPPGRPVALDRMLDIAGRLSVGLDFVRVDLYAVGERVVFGELTAYPDGGQCEVADGVEGRIPLADAWRPHRGR
jgi:hypothetical protein